MAKATWIVCGMDTFPLCNDKGAVVEHTTEDKAVKAAKLHVQTHEDCEAWVFRLSHIVSRPTIEPDVEKVK